MFWRSRWRPLVRLINRCEIGRARRFRLPQIRPHSRPIGEMVHWSALARWEETKADRRWQRYQPRNLLAVIKSVQENGTRVVGLDGEPTSLAGLYAGNADAAEPPREPELRRSCRGRPLVRTAASARTGPMGRPGIRYRGWRGEGRCASGLPPAPARAGHPPEPARLCVISGRA